MDVRVGVLVLFVLGASWASDARQLANLNLPVTKTAPIFKRWKLKLYKFLGMNLLGMIMRAHCVRSLLARHLITLVKTRPRPRSLKPYIRPALNCALSSSSVSLWWTVMLLSSS